MLVRVLVLAIVVVLGLPRSAKAQTPVIESGREREVLALFAPHQLGQDVTPGWKLWDIAVSPLAIDVECHGPDERRARFRLSHPSAANGEHTRSFVIERDSSSDPAGSPALDALASAVTKNDPGGFFKGSGVPRVPIASNRARFILVPVVTAVLALAGMLLTVRRARGTR